MKVVLFANTDWYLFNFRLPLALALRAAGHDVVLLSSDGPYGQRFGALGLRWRPIKFRRRSLNPLGEAFLVAKLARILRAEKPDVIHSFTLKCAVYGSISGFLGGVRVRVGSIAGLGYVFTSSSLLARLLRPILVFILRLTFSGSSTVLIAQNDDDLRLMRMLRVARAQRARVIPGSGVDCERFSPGRAAKAGEPVTVLLPARMLWDKGVAEFVGAARCLKRSNGSMRFVLAGAIDDGNPSSIPEGMIRSWVDEGVVEWLGHVDDMALLLRSVDIVVLPSYREGLSKSLIEAAASGCAIVTTDVPGCRDVIVDGQSGLVVKPRSIGALIEAVQFLAENRERRLAFGLAARDRALECFEVGKIDQATMELYEEFFG